MRAGGAELHVTAAVVGGVVAQEAVKLLAGMYEPVRFFYNGVQRAAQITLSEGAACSNVYNVNTSIFVDFYC